MFVLCLKNGMKELIMLSFIAFSDTKLVTTNNFFCDTFYFDFKMNILLVCLLIKHCCNI